jgi:hypothetical protein
MALQPSRQVFQTNVENTCSGVAERGGIMSFVPGVAGLVAYANAAAVSGQLVQPLGILLDDVENLNYYNHPEYRQRNVVPQGSVVGICTEGEFWTDKVETTGPGAISVGTYAPGDVLYLADDGNVSRNNGTFNNGATAKRVIVGKALSALGSDGFLKVRIDL